MASIYAVQKVSHIYFAYKYIIYTHVITCRNIQASREGLPLKRDRALLSDLQPKKKKKRWRHKCPVCASAVDMSASSHWLLPPSLWRASGKDGIGCLESADRKRSCDVTGQAGLSSSSACGVCWRPCYSPPLIGRMGVATQARPGEEEKNGSQFAHAMK